MIINGRRDPHATDANATLAAKGKHGPDWRTPHIFTDVYKLVRFANLFQFQYGLDVDILFFAATAAKFHYNGFNKSIQNYSKSV